MNTNKINGEKEYPKRFAFDKWINFGLNLLLIFFCCEKLLKCVFDFYTKLNGLHGTELFLKLDLNINTKTVGVLDSGVIKHQNFLGVLNFESQVVGLESFVVLN